MSLTIKLCGTRGSTAVAGPQYRRYGGNTSCVAARCAAGGLLLDAGTGLLDGEQWLGSELPELHILLSHYHLDHISALGMSRTAVIPGRRVHIYGPAVDAGGCDEVLRSIFTPPLWPVMLEALSATVTYHTLSPGVVVNLCGFTVTPVALCHPGGSLGYRLEADGKVLCYLCDHEQPLEQDPDRLLPWLQGAHLALCDAPFTDSDLPACRGWGHSTASSVVSLCQRAGVGQVLLTHHAPTSTDDRLDEMQAACEQAVYAREGEEVTL